MTLAGTIALFFTGSYVPVPFFPEWLRVVTGWLPFNGLMNVPAQVFLGKLGGASLFLEVIRQGLWLLVFIVLARYVTAVARRRVVIQGG